ncbi:MAG: hypothetical protein JWO52_7630 [Gammaproteobacteria bacterium]|jgi:hypothetical protein|nr:hypothetical protein [Gammaproteobacteria bacterium]
MPSQLTIGDIRVALKERLFPAITTWNRLEARPRSQNFQRALQAEVRDALWMLTKQWQMGEFRGSDAGSPVFAKLLLATTRLTRYRPAGGPAQLFESSIPLETKVERRRVPLHRQQRILALDLRLVMARQWFALIADVADYRDAFRAAYPITKPDPTQSQDVDVCSHPEAWDTFQALAGRAMDGGALLEYLLADPLHHAYDGVAGIANTDHNALDDRAQRFLVWAARFVTQPTSSADDAWVPDHLDYQFAASAPLPGGTEKVYIAQDYSSGRLDWYSFDLDQSIATLGNVPGSDTTGLPSDAPFTTIPIPVSFSGMPNTRWWAFEDHATNFGDIDASTTDLAKLLFMEFTLVYSNDWFVIPCTLPSGALAQVRGMAVTNVFGERLWIEAADQGTDNAWGRWSMFTINIRNAPAGSISADTTLLLPPTLGSAQPGPTQEEIFLVRDEVADMAWGVERTVQLASGISRPGGEVAKQTFNFLQALVPGGGKPPAMAAAVRYQAMNSVPENWIPFIPVHIPNDNRRIQLQRAAMPRILIGDPNPAQKVQPSTSLLRQGLDLIPTQTFFLHEEEVPRAGARLTQHYSRARWTQGQVYTWLRVQKQTGRGEASSGLAFDRLVDERGSEA